MNDLPRPPAAAAKPTAVRSRTATVVPAAEIEGHPLLKDIEVLIRARYPVIYIVSYEEARVQEWLAGVAAKRQKKVWEWSTTTGLVQAGQGSKARNAATRDPQAAFEEVMAHVEPAIYLFKDLHPYLCASNVAVIRKLKELAIAIKDSYKTVVLVAPTLALTPELEKEITVVDFPLPAADEFSRLLNRILAEVRGQPGIAADVDGETRERLLQAAVGLTLGEAENVFARTLVATGRLGPEAVAMVAAEKKQIIRKNGLLEYHDPDVAFAEVGGLDLLKAWLKQRALSFGSRARQFGLPPPKGVLLLGVQGCGKSLCAKSVAGLWRMPLLRLDVGRMFGSLVGASEENMRKALQVAESVAPVVLWLDEIDKALSGSRGSGGTDGGTTARVFSTFLTWLGEKSSTVFVVATANDISDLPPELLRKGRFDELFFVDLPSLKERESVMRIHLQRRNRDPATFDLPAIAEAAAGFSGAELEQVVVEALFSAFSSDGELTTAHILQAIAVTVPLSRTMEAEITRLREWAAGRARPASSVTPVHEVPPRRKIELAEDPT